MLTGIALDGEEVCEEYMNTTVCNEQQLFNIPSLEQTGEAQWVPNSGNSIIEASPHTGSVRSLESCAGRHTYTYTAYVCKRALIRNKCARTCSSCDLSYIMTSCHLANLQADDIVTRRRRTGSDPPRVFFDTSVRSVPVESRNFSLGPLVCK